MASAAKLLAELLQKRVGKERSFKSGGIVSRTGNAKIHRGEMIIKQSDVAKVQNAMRKANIKIPPKEKVTPAKKIRPPRQPNLQPDGQSCAVRYKAH